MTAALSLVLTTPLVLSATWTPTADLPDKRMEGNMASLHDGRVAYIGGSQIGRPQPLDTAVLFDGATETWSALPKMTKTRDSPGVCAISKGGVSKLYVFGGAVKYPPPGQSSFKVSASVESLTFDPAPATEWVAETPLPSSRTSPAVTALADGSGCIIAGGFSPASSASMIAAPWSPRSMNSRKGEGGAAARRGTIGDENFMYLHDAWLFDGLNYTRLPDMPCKSSGPSAPCANCGLSNMGVAATKSGIFLVGGGALNPSYFNVSYLQTSPTLGAAWEEKALLTYARSYSMVSALRDPATGDERLVAAGGMSLTPFFDPMASVEIYAPERDSWSLIDDGEPGALPTAIGFGSAARLNTTHMLAGGGAGAGTSGYEAYLFSL